MRFCVTISCSVPDPNFRDALDRLDYVHASAQEKRTTIAKYAETSDDYEGIRFGMTIAFLVLPLVNFLIYVVVVLVPKSARTLFSWSWHLAYCLYILMMVGCSVVLPSVALCNERNPVLVSLDVPPDFQGIVVTLMTRE